jgi:hypothetical protein
MSAEYPLDEETLASVTELEYPSGLKEGWNGALRAKARGGAVTDDAIALRIDN